MKSWPAAKDSVDLRQWLGLDPAAVLESEKHFRIPRITVWCWRCPVRIFLFHSLGSWLLGQSRRTKTRSIIRVRAYMEILEPNKPVRLKHFSFNLGSLLPFTTDYWRFITIWRSDTNGKKKTSKRRSNILVISWLFHLGLERRSRAWSWEFFTIP